MKSGEGFVPDSIAGFSAQFVFAVVVVGSSIVVCSSDGPRISRLLILTRRAMDTL